MADPFGIVGTINLTIQIAQTVVQFGLDWKVAPHDAKTFLTEPQTLKTVLSETNTNLLLNSDFEAAFQIQPSLLLSQLGLIAHRRLAPGYNSSLSKRPGISTVRAQEERQMTLSGVGAAERSVPGREGSRVGGEPAATMSNIE
jgi:hypothetical protein